MNHQPSTGNWKLETITHQLLDYCRKNDWAGYDPYDALNSELFNHLPFLDFKLPRLALTQLLKRSPINFRPLLMVSKTHSSKAIALFLMAFLRLKKVGLLKDIGLIPLMAQKLVALRSPDVSVSSHLPPPSSLRYWCWGYNFPWQSRVGLVPRGTPNLVCTAFVANALLDLYEFHRRSSCEAALRPATSHVSYLEMAVSAAKYISNELYWEDNDATGFCYPLPLQRSRVHNANFLGAALLCRASSLSGQTEFLERALNAARYSAEHQHSDGSWDYGEYPTQRWIDNFHTGYNLCSLWNINKYLKTNEFEPHIRRGLKFYRDRFFQEDGAPKYFHNKTYPIDIHSVAQSIITLIELKDLDQDNVAVAQSVLAWAMNNLWNERGYFYYQLTPYYKNRISYMRWSHAWMLLALATMEDGQGAPKKG